VRQQAAARERGWTYRADEVVADGAAKVRGEALRNALPDAWKRKTTTKTNQVSRHGIWLRPAASCGESMVNRARLLSRWIAAYRRRPG
jgi:hypothetical protein